MDLAKAFNTVDPRKLVEKLNGIGIEGPLLEWFSTYLTRRTQMVKIYGSFSDKLTTEFGVSQGSVL